MQQKPSAWKRARAAINFFRNGWRAISPRSGSPASTKSSPLILPAWRDGEPLWQLVDFESYAQEGFNENAILFSAIMYKVRSITIAPLKAYGGTPEEPKLLPVAHPLQRLVSRPNRWQSQAEFQGQAEVFLNIAGNVYIVLDRERGTQVPRAMYLLRPDRVFIVPSKDKREIIGFLYVPEGASIRDGVPYLAQDVIHIKYPNPLDPIEGLGYGLPPVSSMARSVDVDNSVTRYLKLFFQNGAMPPGVLKFNHPMDDKMVTAARERWMEIYGGFDNWADIAVLDQGGSYEKLGLDFKELDMSVLDARNESRMSAPLGVPMTLIESRPQMVQSTYSNKSTDRVMFWEDTMVPELRWFEVDYQYFIQGDNGEFVAFDLSKVPALTLTPKDRNDLATAAFTAGGITRAEYRAILPFAVDPEAEDTTSPPSEGAPEAEEEAEKEGEEVSEEGEKGAKAIFNITYNVSPAIEKMKRQLKEMDRYAFWVKSDELAIDHEGDYTDATHAAFEGDRRAVLAILGAKGKAALSRKATVDYTSAIANIEEYYEAEGRAASSWSNELDAAIDSLVSAKVIQLNGEFGFDTPPGDILSQNWLEEYKLVFAQPINETSSKEITALLQQGIDEGWGAGEAVKNLNLVFDQWIDGELPEEEFDWIAQRRPYHRTEAIVRTETIRATNAASNATYGVWGVQQKEWLATGDARVRKSHKAADGQTVAIDDAFDVGGSSLRFPGDPEGSSDQTINCRCSLLPVI